MDSGSGSMQSSSGGDEEYDSRAESISAFLNHPSSHLGSLPANPQSQSQPQPHPQHQQTHTMFDPLSNYFDPSVRSVSVSLTNPNSLLNLDMVWPKSSRSDPNQTDLGSLIAPSHSQPFLTTTTNNQIGGGGGGGQSRAATFHSIQIPPDQNASSRASPNENQAPPSNTNTNMVRNPKKRSRASRRAPTTVLTTDTTNFRAMVQEFTGIPAPPFTSSPFPRTRLDLFGTSSSLRSSSGGLDPGHPSYLLRPFAQKAQPPVSSASNSSAPPSISFHSSSMVDVLAGGGGSNSTTNASNSNPINYHNLLNMNMQQSPMNLNFQSLLQAQPKFSLSNSPKIGVLEEFGLPQHHVTTQLMSGLPNMVSSDGTLSRSDNNISNNNNNNSNNPSTNWANESSGGGDHDHQGFLRSLNGSYSNSERVTNNGKLNYSAASSSDFHGDKGSENVATRSEGMVESWICSSD